MNITAHRCNSVRSLVTFSIALVLLPALYQRRAEAQTNIFPASGNVGIGTTTPNYPLDVIVNSQWAARFKKTDATHGGIMIDAAAGYNPNLGLAVNGALKWYLNSNSNNGDTLQFWESTGGHPRLTLTQAGNVGIGTSGPLKQLHVYGGASGTNPSPTTHQLALENNNDAGLSILNPDNKIGRIMFGTPSGSSGPTSGLIRWDYTNRNFDFATDQTGGYIRFLTGSFFERVRIDSNGNVGIGTTTPAAKLEVDGSGIFRVTEGARVTPTSGVGLELSANSGGSYVAAYNRTTSAYRPLTFAGSTYYFENGNVGLGTAPNSQYKLDVNGSINVSGNINAKYQDVAEWVESSQTLPAGTVVVLDSTKSNQVIASSDSYDTRVAGVVSKQPGISLGESGAGKVLVATTGRVRMRVDATRAAIHVGDLLVTSDSPGAAMKSEPVSIGGIQLHRPGTLIGKALEPLEKGTGEILVLLSLQ